jgi:hypothetical protein
MCKIISQKVNKNLMKLIQNRDNHNRILNNVMNAMEKIV